MEINYNFAKAMPICGISILDMPKDKYLNIKIKKTINEKTMQFNAKILTKEQFISIYNNKCFKYFGNFEYNDCDLVIIYESIENNSEELNYIKCILTSVYFADRLTNEKIKFESSAIFNNLKENYYTDKSNQFSLLRAPIEIGPKPADKNYYNESISRLYGINLEREYKGHAMYLNSFNIRNSKLFVEYNDYLEENISNIINKLNDNSEYSKRMMSAFRLLFDTIQEYDYEKNIISYGTIFETLLLSNDESNQRRKVAVRSACVLCEELNLKEREYIAEIVYQFYSYRNKIVHDGYSFLDLGNEFDVKDMLNCIKHIIYFLIRKIVIKDIKEIKEIKEIVKSSMINDSLDNAFDYISEDTSLAKVIQRLFSYEHHEFRKPYTKEEIELDELSIIKRSKML